MLIKKSLGNCNVPPPQQTQQVARRCLHAPYRTRISATFIRISSPNPRKSSNLYSPLPFSRCTYTSNAPCCLAVSLELLAALGRQTTLCARMSWSRGRRRVSWFMLE